MATKRIAGAATRLAQSRSTLLTRDPLMQCLVPSLNRSLATEATTRTAVEETTPILTSSNAPNILAFYNDQSLRRPEPATQSVLTTVHSFPTLEPLRFETYPANELFLPLRRDILHRAVVFEGDGERQGSASTKWRSEVRGSGQKIRPQKGSGRARLGDKKSPMLVGGGRAFGPKPRDFSTKLPKKIYDLAWRTALSYRYRRGQLIVVEDGVELDIAEPRWFMRIMTANRIGNADGRSLIVTTDRRPNLWQAVAGAGRHGECLTVEEVDVKNLLELGRIIVEKSALDAMIEQHSSDLDCFKPSAVY